MSNQPLFDPLNATPEEQEDMLAGYIFGGLQTQKPDLVTMA